MNLRQLEVFQAIMQTGNMSAAARLINITPSAVSKAVAHTELQLGYKLFTRSKGALAPTPEAMVLHGESTSIHGKLEELRKIAVNLRQVEQGQVRLAAIPSISHEFLPLVLQRHVARYPRVSVEVRTLHQEQMVAALMTRGVDFALGFYEHPHPQLTSRVLVSGRLYLAVTREIWLRAIRVRRNNPMSFLSNTPMIRLVGDDPMREAIDALARQLGVTKELDVQVQTSRLALELVRLGMGWTVIDFLTASNLDPASMVAVELQDLPPMALHVYHANTFPPGQHALRMLDMLPGLLGQAMARSPQAG
ncbi:MAG TPA: LysR family transcriptional regulator [Burkholderiaceae bacterium]|nr:LysR family transcriptional regulator [Burkholderiaceae bacterium]